MKKKYYLTLDTETATLPFANDLCTNATQKQKIAIAKPLVYDIGWIITDRKGNTIKTENYLVQETFFVPSVFNTAYYKDKRPIYINLLNQGKISVLPWNQIIDKLYFDLSNCDIATAYNATFDYKKAIPFTERYIKHLYSADYNDWEQKQKEKCIKIIKGYDNSKNEKYLEPYFELRETKFPIVDLWGVACQSLINNCSYKEFCMKNGLFTTSAIYFKTSAETSFQYLTKQHDFIESHTALDDAIIESEILTKALKKKKVEPNLEAFPFRNLGTTYDYALKNPKYKKVVHDALLEYIVQNCTQTSGYWARLENIVSMLEEVENE